MNLNTVKAYICGTNSNSVVLFSIGDFSKNKNNYSIASFSKNNYSLGRFSKNNYSINSYSIGNFSINNYSIGRLLKCFLSLIFFTISIAVSAQEWMNVYRNYDNTVWKFPYNSEHFNYFDFTDDQSAMRAYYGDVSSQDTVYFPLENLDSVVFSSSSDSYGESKYKVFTMNITTVGNAPIVSKDDYVNCLVSVDGKGEFEDYSGTARIRGRGNSTWLWYPKKPYRLKLDVKDKILGLKKNRDWVLLANYRDVTDMMNTFGFETAAWLGMPFTNHTRYVEVFLNGDYIGVYQLTEQVEVGGHRVDISETEGVLLSFDLDDGPGLSPDATDNFYSSVYGMPMCIKHPDDLTPEQIDKIRDDFSVLENAIYTNDYAAVDTLMDIPQFINMLMLQEFLYNVDFTAPRSLYMYRDYNGKYTMGPVWDWDAGYDFDWNNMEHSHNFFDSYTELIFGTNPVRQNGGYKMPKFFTDLFAVEDFVVEYKRRWAEVSDSIVTRNWKEIIKYVTHLKRGAYRRDAERWPIRWDVNTELSELKSWLTKRVDYLNGVVASYPITRPVPTTRKHYGEIQVSQTLDFYRGYSQNVMVNIDSELLSEKLGMSADLISFANGLSYYPLNNDRSIGQNNTTGDFGGWFNSDGEPRYWNEGHVYIEIFDDPFHWKCGAHPDNCRKGHEHTVVMQLQCPDYEENVVKTLDIVVTFKIN